MEGGGINNRYHQSSLFISFYVTSNSNDCTYCLRSFICCFLFYCHVSWFL